MKKAIVNGEKGGKKKKSGELTGSIRMVPGGPGTPSAPGIPGRPAGP